VVQKKHVARRNMSRNTENLAYAYVAPAFIIMGLVVFYPFVYNVVVSFSNMNLSHFRDWQFKGIGNYLLVLKEGDFWYFFGILHTKGHWIYFI